jgi:WD40 repeat protein
VSLGNAGLSVLRGHKAWVTSVDWSRDGYRIVSGSEDGEIRVWDVESAAELALLEGHKGCVRAVRFSPDGRFIASGAGSEFSDDRTVRVWEASSGAQLTVMSGHDEQVMSVGWSPNGLHIVSGSLDGIVRVWDAMTGKEVAVFEFRGGTDRVSAVSFSPDGCRLAIASLDASAQVWNADTGEELGSFSGECLDWSPDGERIVSGSEDGRAVRVWDANGAGEFRMLWESRRSQPKYAVTSVRFSPDGAWIASGSEDGTARIWDAVTGEEQAVLRGHLRTVTDVSWSPDGRNVLSGSCDKTLRLYRTEGQGQTAMLFGHGAWVKCVYYSPDGRFIATASDSRSADDTVRVWDAENGQQLTVLQGGRGGLTGLHICWSPDSTRLASGERGAVRVWAVESGQQLLLMGAKGFGDVQSVNWSPDGRRIASGADDKAVRIWDAESGAELAVLGGHEGSVLGVSWSSDSSRIFSKCHNPAMIHSTAPFWEKCPIRVWDAESFACLHFNCRPASLTETYPPRNASSVHSFRWRAHSEGSETVITRAATGYEIAWFPDALEHLDPHPSSSQWAGSVGNHLFIIALECQPETNWA